MTGETDTEIQAKLITALQDPSIYELTTDRVEMLETHISYVFLAGAYAYKLKKAVELGFLDFRTLAARRHYCEEELRLNRRLAPALYLEVVPITGSADHPALDGDGQIIEYAVKMNRFSQDQLLNRLLMHHQLRPRQIDELAQVVAAFHASIAIASDNDSFGTPAAIQQPALENFSQIASELFHPQDRADLDFLRNWTVDNCYS
ncbi:MAG TPA: hypothetical protein VM532_07220, partial [Burkholderiales bacterium]|nr:hypothetical protein [Burkholderiales bacterium]